MTNDYNLGSKNGGSYNNLNTFNLPDNTPLSIRFKNVTKSGDGLFNSISSDRETLVQVFNAACSNPNWIRCNEDSFLNIVTRLERMISEESVADNTPALTEILWISMWIIMSVVVIKQKD